MSRLNLTFACWDYDRVKPLADRTVTAEGIDLNIVNLPVEETFFRMLRYREFDLAEMSLSSYTVSLSRPDSGFVAIPVFPSRMFRHSGIFVSAASGIREPRDLVGKRIGVPEYQLTAPVWIRGILQDEYGVDPASVSYFTGGEENPGREEKVKLSLPAKFRVSAIPSDKTLSAMIAEGEVDAIYAPRSPSTLHTRPDRVRRLFPDYVEREKAYFAKTKLFPIMHTVVLRRELFEANRWIARSLFKAFIEAQRIVYEQLSIPASLKTMLPWQIPQVEEAMALMGTDWWPYGFDANRAVLETFLRYHHEQGLSPRRLKPEELFVPETTEAFKI